MPDLGWCKRCESTRLTDTVHGYRCFGCFPSGHPEPRFERPYLKGETK